MKELDSIGLTEFGGTGFTYEVDPLRRIGQETEASSTLRRSFLPIWSEILRRVRRTDFANSRWSMQPLSRKLSLVNSAYGRYFPDGRRGLGCEPVLLG